MTCEKAFDRYLGLDKHDRVPLTVTLHLLACPACRTAVRRVTRAERILAKPLAVEPLSAELSAADSVVQEALRRINASGLGFPQGFSEEGRVSLSRWLASGLALSAGFSILPFSQVGAWSRAVFGTGYLVSYFLLCGVAVTAWCGLFVGTNIDLFVKKFGFEG